MPDWVGILWNIGQIVLNFQKLKTMASPPYQCIFPFVCNEKHRIENISKGTINFIVFLRFTTFLWVTGKIRITKQTFRYLIFLMYCSRGFFSKARTFASEGSVVNMEQLKWHFLPLLTGTRLHVGTLPT